MPAKLVVIARDGGSQISLVGASGKALLTSVVFTEPRAKGATFARAQGNAGRQRRSRRPYAVGVVGPGPFERRSAGGDKGEAGGQDHQEVDGPAVQERERRQCHWYQGQAGQARPQVDKIGLKASARIGGLSLPYPGREVSWPEPRAHLRF